ncbi:hypothetical protein BDR07DRAFT_1477621 [Suillus spraguei]|nr:hypothetical protein BDR07DRAFT_1477621 [Suillus spraguei]
MLKPIKKVLQDFKIDKAEWQAHTPSGTPAKRKLFIAVSSNKGLCGSIHSSASKATPAPGMVNQPSAASLIYSFDQPASGMVNQPSAASLVYSFDRPAPGTVNQPSAASLVYPAPGMVNQLMVNQPSVASLVYSTPGMVNQLMVNWPSVASHVYSFGQPAPGMVNRPMVNQPSVASFVYSTPDMVNQLMVNWPSVASLVYSFGRPAPGMVNQLVVNRPMVNRSSVASLVYSFARPAPGMLNQLVVNRPSVASLIYSFDRYAVRYEAMMSVQHPHQEKIDELRKLVYMSSHLQTPSMLLLSRLMHWSGDVQIHPFLFTPLSRNLRRCLLPSQIMGIRGLWERVTLSAENQTFKELAVSELKTEDVEGNHRFQLFKIGIDPVDAQHLRCLSNQPCRSWKVARAVDTVLSTAGTTEAATACCYDHAKPEISKKSWSYMGLYQRVVNQRGLASARTLCPLPEYVPLILDEVQGRVLVESGWRVRTNSKAG